MRVERGSPLDARDIAKLYSVAFPESVELFFGKRTPEKLLDLLELTFSLVLQWGTESLLVKDDAGSIRGYCLYSTKEEPSAKRSYRKALAILGKMALQISLGELTRLLHNQVLMTTSVRYTRASAAKKVTARIVSIAIDPDFQGQGLGTLLFSSVLRDLQDQSIGLNVRANNAAALRLYQSAGFQPLGTTKDLLGEWLVLERPPRDAAVL